VNPVVRLHALRRAVARRRVAIALALLAPPSLALAWAATRLSGYAAGLVVSACLLVFAAGVAGSVRRRASDAWLARRLDARVPAMEDSAALLFATPASLAPLQRLQQARLRQRVAVLDVDLRPAWPRVALAASAGVAAAIVLVVALGGTGILLPTGTSVPGAAREGGTTRIERVDIAIQPPAYTGRAAGHADALDLEVLEGSRLDWQLRFAPEPASAALVFHDGRRLPLQRQGRDWRAGEEVRASRLYRVEFDGSAPAAGELHRLDVIPDRAPEIRVIHPDRSLSLLEAGQAGWRVEFEASDDHGLAAAELELTLAQGSGESVAFSGRTLVLEPVAPVPGAPGPVTARYVQALDLAALGLAEGDDLIVKPIVRDNRQPEPNVARSASFILRWPAEPSSDTAGLEGVVQRTLPAYFRSQRQIIIDSEALVAQRGTLADAAFLDRSDAIGVDQKILRLRYGQFLGEEAEGQEHAGPDPGAGHAGQHGHGDAPAGFGQSTDVVAEYGHVHDIAEAATLLDEETKATLKSALAEMWQAELHLRQGDPEQALPYEHRALAFIKQVQQATRIHLARVGLELPQVDATRRLGGDLDGLTDRAVERLETVREDDVPLGFWRALSAPGAPDVEPLRRWIAGRAGDGPDALGVLAALDRFERDPACGVCRDALRKALWPLLPIPAAEVGRLPQPDAAGRAYLDALPSSTGDSL